MNYTATMTGTKGSVALEVDEPKALFRCTCQVCQSTWESTVSRPGGKPGLTVLNMAKDNNWEDLKLALACGHSAQVMTSTQFISLPSKKVHRFRYARKNLLGTQCKECRSGTFKPHPKGWPFVRCFNCALQVNQWEYVSQEESELDQWPCPDSFPMSGWASPGLPTGYNCPDCGLRLLVLGECIVCPTCQKDKGKAFDSKALEQQEKLGKKCGLCGTLLHRGFWHDVKSCGWRCLVCKPAVESFAKNTCDRFTEEPSNEQSLLDKLASELYRMHLRAPGQCGVEAALKVAKDLKKVEEDRDSYAEGYNTALMDLAAARREAHKYHSLLEASGWTFEGAEPKPPIGPRPRWLLEEKLAAFQGGLRALVTACESILPWVSHEGVNQMRKDAFRLQLDQAKKLLEGKPAANTDSLSSSAEEYHSGEGGAGT